MPAMLLSTVSPLTYGEGSNPGAGDEEPANEITPEDPAVWTDVIFNLERQGRRSEDDGSMVMVSRASTPLSLLFQDVTISESSPVTISWPKSLPWWRFRSLYFPDIVREASLFHQAASMQENKSSLLLIGMSSTSLLENTCRYGARSGRAISEMGRSMPEAFEGEHSKIVETMLGGDSVQKQRQALYLLAYQLSNNLVEVDYEDSDYGDDEYEKTVKLFRDLGIPKEQWTSVFIAGKDPTMSAFLEALFEAAINTDAQDIIESLLSCGVDPNRPIRNFSEMGMPLQVTVRSRRCSLEIVKLLVHAGADVEGVTEENDEPVLHTAASHGTLEMVQFLVESGADVRRSVDNGSYGPGYRMTALLSALTRFEPDEDYNSESDSGPETVEDKPTESKDIGHIANLWSDRDDMIEAKTSRIFLYLLSLLDESADHDLIQDALIFAAYRRRLDLVRLLCSVRADLDERSPSGCTALDAVAMSELDSIPLATLLIELGARVHSPEHSGMTTLHIAAARGNSELVQLLVNNGARVNCTAAFDLNYHKHMLGKSPRFQWILPQTQETLDHLQTPLQLALIQTRKYSYATQKSPRGALTLLAAGADLRGGELVQAAEFPGLELIQAILDRGADVNEVLWDGRCALEASLATGNIDIAQLLLQKGALLRRHEVRLAIYTGNIDLVRLLVDHGGDLKSRGPGGVSMLEAAAITRQYQMMKWLSRSLPDTYDPAALCATVCCAGISDNVLGQVESLLKYRQPELILGLLEATALGCAAYSGNWPILNLLRRLPRTSSTCIVPLQGYGGYTALVDGTKLPYLYRRCRPWWRDRSGLRCSVLVPALLNEDWAITSKLLQMHYRPDALSLLVAIGRRTTDEVEIFLRYVFNVNDHAHHNLDTALQYAVRLQKVDVVKLLLRRRANVNDLPSVLVPIYENDVTWINKLLPRSALQAAVENGHLELIGILLDAGADVNGSWSLDGGASALQLAAAKGYLGIARRLLSLGARINAPRAERHGRTALEGAAEQGRLDMVQFLLETGAKTMGEGIWQYHRAIGFALKNGHRTVSGLLKEWRDWHSLDDLVSRYDGLLDDVFVEPDLDDLTEVSVTDSGDDRGSLADWTEDDD